MTSKTKTHLLLCVIVLFLVAFYYYYISMVVARKKHQKTVNTHTPFLGKRNRDFSVDDFDVEGEMGDVEVVLDLRDHFLVPPSPLDVPYNLTRPEIVDPSVAQAYIVKRILNGTRNGFFVECGAYDGEFMSNTLMFERDYNWTGLLIEPSPLAYSRLAAKNRKAYISPTCLSRSTRQEKVMFINAGVGSHIVRVEEERQGMKTTEVRCFPLYSYLLALNRRVVDYLSLDVEGNELDVLKTIPFHLVDIRVLTIEFFLLSNEKAKLLLRYMQDNGYYLHSEIRIKPDHGADDYIFVKKDDGQSR